MRPSSFVLVLSLPLSFPTSASAQVADGVYAGVTTQNRVASVTVSGGQVTGYSLSYTGVCSGTGTTTVTTTCPITNGSFTCGSAFCTGVTLTSSIAGTFVGPHVVAKATLIGPCCGGLTDMPWIGTVDSLLFEDGFEVQSTGAWSTTAGAGPFLELWVRNRYWRSGPQSDTLSASLDGSFLFSLTEATPGWQATYRPLVLDVSSLAGQQIDLTIAASSLTDGGRADFFVDDVSTFCPGGGGNVVLDGGFEDTSGNADWTQSSTNYPTPICDASCGAGAARTGTKLVWTGRAASEEHASVTQSLTLPVCP